MAILTVALAWGLHRSSCRSAWRSPLLRRRQALHAFCASCRCALLLLAGLLERFAQADADAKGVLSVSLDLNVTVLDVRLPESFHYASLCVMQTHFLTASGARRTPFPVFGEANVKQAFSVASAVFQGRHRRTGESVLVSVSYSTRGLS